MRPEPECDSATASAACFLSRDAAPVRQTAKASCDGGNVIAGLETASLRPLSTIATTRGTSGFQTATRTTTTRTTSCGACPPGGERRGSTLNLHDEYGYQDIFKAYIDCRRAKRNSRSSIAFETKFETRLDELLEEINTGSYKIGRSEVFVQEHPKPREIWAAKFRDRIVHHLVYNDIGPYFENRFIEDTFSCIPGRGTLHASKRLDDFHRRITNNYEHDCWALQFDIKNFFVSIDKDVLWGGFEKVIGTESLTSRLMRQIIYYDPTVNPIIKPNSNFSLVPAHKSLWNAGKNKGLPIGNHTSQFSSNVHLDPLDKFVKHVLGARYYVRYVDDAVILHEDRDTLVCFLDRISAFLAEELKLEIHPNKCSIKRASQGMNFVGVIIKPYRKYTRRSTVLSAKRVARSCDPSTVPSINSYLGIMKHTNSHNLRREICENALIPSLVGYSRDFSKVVRL